MQIDQQFEAKMEPFDSFWEAPSNIEKGYKKFATFYQRNYFKYLKIDPTDRVLVVSCGPGYFLNTLKNNFSDHPQLCRSIHEISMKCWFTMWTLMIIEESIMGREHWEKKISGLAGSVGVESAGPVLVITSGWLI